MSGWFAHERYGGTPRVGESQVLSSKGEAGSPSWVVTTPGFSWHFEKTEVEGEEMKPVRDYFVSPEDDLYITLSKAFSRIREFNAGQDEPKIRVLGFDLEFLFLPRGDVRGEAEAALRAYLDYCQERT
jgi:hypothetical protein